MGRCWTDFIDDHFDACNQNLQVHPAKKIIEANKQKTPHARDSYSLSGFVIRFSESILESGFDIG